MENAHGTCRPEYYDHQCWVDGGLCTIPAQFRKNGTIVAHDHVIPLLPSAWAVVEKLAVSHDLESGGSFRS